MRKWLFKLMLPWLVTCEVCKHRKGTSNRPFHGTERWMCNDCANYIQSAHKYEVLPPTRKVQV